MFGLPPRTHRERHNEPDGTIAPGAHPGVFRPRLYYVALYRPFPGATIGPEMSLRAELHGFFVRAVLERERRGGFGDVAAVYGDAIAAGTLDLEKNRGRCQHPR